MYVNKYEVNITTDASGDGVGYTPDVNGRLLSISYVKPSSGGYAAGVDFDIVGETSGVEILDKDDVNASVTYCPRQPTHTTKGAAAEYATGMAVNDFIYLNERIKITVDAGGNKGTGKFIVYVG